MSIARGNPEPSRRYSQKELAALWRVHPVTVRKWVMKLRREGRGPSPEQAKIKLIRGAKRDLIIRSDYALLIEKVFVERAEIKRFRL